MSTKAFFILLLKLPCYSHHSVRRLSLGAAFKVWIYIGAYYTFSGIFVIRVQMWLEMYFEARTFFLFWFWLYDCFVNFFAFSSHFNTMYAHLVSLIWFPISKSSLFPRELLYLMFSFPFVLLFCFSTQNWHLVERSCFVLLLRLKKMWLYCVVSRCRLGQNLGTSVWFLVYQKVLQNPFFMYTFFFSFT